MDYAVKLCTESLRLQCLTAKFGSGFLLFVFLFLFFCCCKFGSVFLGGKAGEISAEWSLSCDCTLSLYSASASSALLPLGVCLWPLAFPNQTNFPFRQVKGGITHGASNHVTITILGLT